MPNIGAIALPAYEPQSPKAEYIWDVSIPIVDESESEYCSNCPEWTKEHFIIWLAGHIEEGQPFECLLTHKRNGSKSSNRCKIREILPYIAIFCCILVIIGYWSLLLELILTEFNCFFIRASIIINCLAMLFHLPLILNQSNYAA